MDSGKMRHRIIIQRPSNDNESGANTETWNTFATVWAEKAPLTGREFWESQQQNSKVSVRWRIRWIRNLKPKYRILDGNDRHEIVSIIDRDARYRELELMTEAITDEYNN